MRARGLAIDLSVVFSKLSGSFYSAASSSSLLFSVIRGAPARRYQGRDGRAASATGRKKQEAVWGVGGALRGRGANLPSGQDLRRQKWRIYSRHAEDLVPRMFEFIPETVENYDPGESPARKFRTRNQRGGGRGGGPFRAGEGAMDTERRVESENGGRGSVHRLIFGGVRRSVLVICPLSGTVRTRRHSSSTSCGGPPMLCCSPKSELVNLFPINE